MVGRSLYVTVVAVVALQEGPNIENSSGVHITEMLAVDCVWYIGYHYMCWMVTGALADRGMNSSLSSAFLIGLVETKLGLSWLS